MVKCKSFAPVISEKSKILILGSMPGIKSLELSQYYAHPQNRFWKIMRMLCDVQDMNLLDYDKRLSILLQNNFALWDVIGLCNREGSLDTAIKDEKPNDIKKLLKDYPNIKRICFNGNKAFSSFKKYFSDILDEYECIVLPSTSPANAKFQIDKLFEYWTKIIFR